MSGRRLWPDRLMTGLLYAVAILSIATILIRLPAARRNHPRGDDLVLWIVLSLTAMLVCAVFGGGISEAQYRYQGRLIWMVPYLAMLTLFVSRRSSHDAAPHARSDASTSTGSIKGIIAQP